LQIEQHDPKIFRIVFEKLLEGKDYHIAPPTEKNTMLIREYKKILNKEEIRNK
jgi:hypothetical protein